jgi:hypothetical protein
VEELFSDPYHDCLEDWSDDTDDGDSPAESEPEPAPGELAFIWIDTGGTEWGWPAADMPNWNPADDDGEGLTGDPAEAMQHWHIQEQPDTCAIACQEFVLDEVTGIDHSERALMDEAMSRGWYSPGGGTPMDLVGKLLEVHGLEVQRSWDADLDYLEQQISEGHKVLVAVDGGELHTVGVDPLRDDVIGDQGAWPGFDANHCVQVIGFDEGPDGRQRVILNDPGSADGKGMMVDAEKFNAAWEDSGRFVCHTTGQAPVPSQTPAWSDLPPAFTAQLGYWEKTHSNGYWYEYAPDGTYTGNWGE